MFKIQEKDKPETATWLVKVDTLLANTGKADIHFKSYVANHTTVNLTQQENELFIDRFDPLLAVRVNNRPITHKTALHHKDIIHIGDTIFEILSPQQEMRRLIEPSLRDPRQWVLQDAGVCHHRYKLTPHAILGSAQDCDIVIPESTLAERQLAFSVTGGKVLVANLNQRLHCRVNGKEQMESLLDDGDEITLGTALHFRLIAPANKKPTTEPALALSPLANDTSPATGTHTTSSGKFRQGKPTSNGNRNHDRIDELLMKQKRLKAIINLSLLTSSLCVLLAGTYLLSA